MPVLLWPVSNGTVRKIEKCVENHQEIYWQRTRKNEIQLRAVTYTCENGKFRSKALWVFADFCDDDINDAYRLQSAVASLYAEKYRTLAPSGIEKYLSDMFFDGVISSTRTIQPGKELPALNSTVNN